MSQNRRDGNKLSGAANGSALKVPTKVGGSVRKLTINAPSVNGVCLAQQNLFYTADNAIFVTAANSKKSPEEATIKTVSAALASPQGYYMAAHQSKLCC